MNNSKIDTVTINTLCRKHRVRELSLFGSALSNRFTGSSDIDLLVEFEADVKIGFLKLAQLQNELSDLFNRHVDLVPKDGLKKFIRDDVLASAKVIYAS